MKLRRSVALILATGCTAAVFAWSHAELRAHKTIIGAERSLMEKGDAAEITTGTAMVTSATGMDGADGALTSRVYSLEIDSARKELETAKSAELRADEEVRQAEEDLAAIQNQASSLDSERARAGLAEVDAGRELERRESLLQSGLTSRFDYNAAVNARASAQAAVDSIESKLAEMSVETDVLEAKAQAAEADLREATTRRYEAEAALVQVEAGLQFGHRP